MLEYRETYKWKSNIKCPSTEFEREGENHGGSELLGEEERGKRGGVMADLSRWTMKNEFSLFILVIFYAD